MNKIVTKFRETKNCNRKTYFINIDAWEKETRPLYIIIENTGNIIRIDRNRVKENIFEYIKMKLIEIKFPNRFNYYWFLSFTKIIYKIFKKYLLKINKY